MATFWQDLRYGVRMMAKRPVFTAVAVLSLALGIGANSAIFAIVDNFLWAPFPGVNDADGIYYLSTTDPKNPGLLPVSTLNYEDYRDQNQVFDELAAFGFGTPMDLTAGGETERIFGQMVTVNYFQTLRVGFTQGRGFLPEEGKALGGEPVVVLSHGLWQRRFGSDENILGKPITLNNRPYTVVGIAPQGFEGTFPGFSPAVYAPYTMRDHLLPALSWLTASRRGLWLLAVGRIKPDISREQAQAGMETLARQLEQQYPDANEGRSVALTTLAEARANPAGQAQNPVPLIAGLLLAVVGVVLLIACANVANLLLARAASRQKEIAVRLAMGASRWRLVRQLLTESLVLAFFGGAVGVLVSFWVTDLLLGFQPTGGFPFQLEASIFLISILTGVIFGLAPAVQTTRPDIHENLKEGGRQSAEGATGHRLRGLLVVAEVALAVVALVGAGLFARSFQNAIGIDPGFDRENVITLNLDVSLQGYEQPRGEQFYRHLQERMGAVAGVQEATLTSRLPLSFGLQRTLRPEEQASSEEDRGVLVNVATVDVGYFDTMKIPIDRGRAFEVTDDANTPPVAIVNGTLAERFFPGQDPLGKRFQFPAGGDGLWTPPIEIVGVARETKYVTLGEDPIPFAYLPFRQDYQAASILVLKTAGDPGGIMPMVRREIRTMDAGLPIFNVLTLEEQIANSLWLPRTGAYLLGAFGLLSLVLAAVGLYGVISYSVSQRTHEIGIRMAMGAQKAHILKMVLRQGLVLVAVGVVIGLGLAYAGSRVIVSLLYGVNAADPVTFLGIAVLLGVVALLACYWPARRATSVDPMFALRYE
jgi:putative ABC transport system permease protein